MRTWLLAAVCGLLVACGNNPEVVAQAPLKVDLDQVIAKGSVVPVDGMTASGQPDEAALQVFANNGYAAVIDLRTPAEDRGIDEQTIVEGLGMSYVTLPVGRDEITFDKARALDELLASYDKPVLVHCRSGGRVGALLALRASVNGADDDAAIAAGRRGGLPEAMDDHVREALAGKE